MIKKRMLMIVLGLLLITGCSSSNEPANELKAEAKTETAAAKTKQKQKSLPNVKILATGGTIAGADKSKTSTTNYRAGAVGVDALIEAVPEMQDIANISGEQIANIGSQNMTNETLLKLSKRANELLASDDVDGIVVTHGTDTLEETAYFLNLVIKSDKPIVVVGSMRPSTAIGADGPSNLYNAVKVAASKEAKGKGTLVVLNDRIASARYVTKTNTTTPDTFKSEEMGNIGVIAEDIYIFNEITKKHTKETDFDISKIDKLPQVDIIYGYQSDGRYLFDAAQKAGAKGIVFAGSGNGSISDAAKKGAIAAVEKGMAVVRSSRTKNGVVTPSQELEKKKLLASNSLNPEKSRILLMLALTKTNDPAKIQKYFNEY
ncbi:L-asparaginase [Bacillus glycinifermentans]|uniref:asparaginase n=1 Tax=Bacillus glycinifermentans TaxID=1664069 RepID=A0A0J6EIL4_9BACI|nr:type II asparaginase [Bacillus glycinifermentans]ATH94248.1 L-asparaginase [Bacillus glycinifermentans]KMM63080.1 L-asparaginase [Bacillus glycinifermentans]KRT95672.1 L-asparaginase [Bacillus glycinifermentans]MEC0484446.1 type II asparaginase [Bacillus glycinifermentans]MEC0496837.1 type II asparaginase [Bacillus glycinifermentans]